MTLPTQYSEPWAAGPDDPYAIEPCEECGAGDRDYGQHEPGCPSGFPTRDDDDVVEHNHFDERDARDDCPACERDVERAEGGL